MKKRRSNTLNRNFSRERKNDNLTKKERSRRMSLVRSKSTKFERDFICELQKHMNKKFSQNDVSILGKPDLVFNKQRVCVFLDSDFWHGWQYPRWRHLLKNDFWREKIERNRKRDKKVTRQLRSQGWIVIRLWEHNLKNIHRKCIEKVVKSINMK